MTLFTNDKERPPFSQFVSLTIYSHTCHIDTRLGCSWQRQASLQPVCLLYSIPIILAFLVPATLNDGQCHTKWNQIALSAAAMVTITITGIKEIGSWMFENKLIFQYLSQDITKVENYITQNFTESKSQSVNGKPSFVWINRELCQHKSMEVLGFPSCCDLQLGEYKHSQWLIEM